MSTSNQDARTASAPFTDWRPDHVGLRVNSREDAIAWYADTLAFEAVQTIEVGSDISYVFLQTPAGERFRIELVSGPGAAGRSTPNRIADSFALTGWHHLCFRVDDVDASVAELRRRDVTILSEPFDIAPIRSRIAFITDPWGNVSELMQGQPV